ncbi:hypothetical protein N9H63_00550 [bacterium]|jgi:hypothetical protein|nr:hypothetical protein [bacterium]
MELTKTDRDLLLKLAKDKKVFLEGNIVKVIKAAEGDKEFKNYLEECRRRDTNARRKRLQVTKQVQEQNKELERANDENVKLMEELKDSLDETSKLKDAAEQAREVAEVAKDEALQDLEVMQKKTQFELISIIVRLALAVIVGVGVTTSALYAFVLYMGYDSKIIESTWSNLFGILLTNSFSIVGTIMGVKYATENKDK